MTEEKQNCPLCGKANGRPFLAGSVDLARLTKLSYASRKEPEFMNFPYVECPVCDLVYTPTPPGSEELGQAYSEADYDSSEEADCAAKTYQRIFTPWIETLVNKRCAIDVGCGNGALLPFLLQKNFKQTVGIEPSSAAISSARPEVRPMLREGLFAEKLIEDLSPDFICTAMTMEHVREPLALVRTMRGKLSSGGLVAIVVHNRRAWLNRLLGKRSPIIDIEHLQLFSHQSLERLFKEAGLTPMFIGAFCNTYPLRYWIRLLPLPSIVKKPVIELLEFLRLARLPITLPVGNMLGVARK